jgi:hypothetical protein
MKRIKHIKDLETEKWRLRAKQLELEQRIAGRLKEMRLQGDPHWFAGGNKTVGNNEGEMVSAAMAYGARLLSQNITGLAGEKIDTVIQKGAAKLADKINRRFRRKSP